MASKGSLGIKNKQVQAVQAKHPDWTVSHATRVVTQHRKAGEAIGGYKVKSKGLHPFGDKPETKPARSDRQTKPERTGGPVKPGKRTPGRTVSRKPPVPNGKPQTRS